MNWDKGSCVTCGNTKEWHEQHPEIRHAFNDGSVPHSATFGVRRADGTRGRIPEPQRGSQTPSPWPFDPVLRQALIDKGVLTVEDLKSAEEKIRTITATFHGTVIMEPPKPTVYRGENPSGQ